MAYSHEILNNFITMKFSLSWREKNYAAAEILLNIISKMLFI